jgi:hypothetical protein
MMQAPKELVYYAHVDKSTLSFTGVSTRLQQTDSIVDVVIDKLLALKFLSGEEQLNKWTAIVDSSTNEYSIIKTTEHVNYSRLQMLENREVLDVDTSSKSDIVLKVVSSDALEIYYHETFTTANVEVVKFTFTKHNDPRAYLGYAYLNKSSANPIVVQIDTSNLSVYTQRLPLSIGIIR